MKVGDFGVCVAPACGSPPPLAEACHGGIMHCHLGVEPPYLPASLPQSQAELRLFAGEEGRSKAADLLEWTDAKHGISAAGRGLADRRIPLLIAQPIIERSLGKAFAPSAANDGDVWVLSQEALGRFQPPADKLTVAVDELNKLKMRAEPTGRYSNPALRALAAVSGKAPSNCTTLTPSFSAVATLSSFELELT